MKQLYKCERCGKVSESKEEILKCEGGHYVFYNQDDYETNIDDKLNAMAEYKEGQEEPQVIHVWFRRAYWDGDNCKEEKRCGKYILISTYEMPLDI